MFDDSARLLSVALLVHHWDNRRGVESQHWTVSQVTVSWGSLSIYDISSVIGFRCLQGAGQVKVRLSDYSRLIICFPNRLSAVMSIGAATLADIFDPAVRGKKVDINNLCVFQWLTLYHDRSWEFTTLHHCLDRYILTHIGQNSDLSLP